MAMSGERGDLGTPHDSAACYSTRQESNIESGTVRRWYVVHTQPHSEIRALENLKRQEFETFCPCTRRSVRHARTTTSVLAPFFPSYIFVRLDISFDQWRSINGTRGVLRLVTTGDLPTAVPVGVVEVLQRQIDATGALGWFSLLKTGEAVRITEGPFADLIGTLANKDASGRVKVLLDLLGRTVCVALRGEYVGPVS